MRRALLAGSVGNVVEWYEFGLFGAFATALAVTFFPGGTTVGSATVLGVFGVFGVAFFARPAGALLFASWGDRHGRRPSLIASILLMSAATAAIGLLPGFTSVGWAAPVLLVLLRLLQGVAIGGEYGASAAFVVEHAPVGRRGWYGGLQWATLGLGLAAALAAGALLSGTLPRAALLAWGWRVPFLLAAPLGLVGLYVRLRTTETPAFRALEQRDEASPTPLRDTLQLARRQVLVGLCVVAAVSGTLNTFFVFLPSELDRSGRASLSMALFASLVGLLAAAVVSPAAGALSDHLGRRPVLICGATLLLVGVVPACWLATHGGTPGLLVGYTVVGIGLGAMGLSAFLSELFPSRLRYSGLSLTYGLGSAAFGGTAPVLAAALIESTGTILSAAAWVTALVGLALVFVIGSPETVGGGLDVSDLSSPLDSSSLGDACREGTT